MKTRESGMPAEAIWDGFFEPDEILRRLRLAPGSGRVVDFGCGHGTFALAAARIISGNVYAIDIEPAMVERTVARAREEGVPNVTAVLRDVVERGTGLGDQVADYAMLFNILHAECPGLLLDEAFRVLRPGGIVAILHWNPDPKTPRGPPMDIRPRPEQCRAWAEASGFRPLPPGTVGLPPYHFGMALVKPRRNGPRTGPDPERAMGPGSRP